MRLAFMSTQDSARLYQVYLDAADLPDEKRSEFLRRECGVDAGLRESVEALLTADRAAGDHWLERRTSGLAAGSLIGPYRVEKMIGRGGMGAVYLARRADGQDEQQVALKLISAGMFNAELRSRFLRERQVLASLSHPTIARLLDAGITREDQPFLVLEYVQGVPIDRFCDERRLGVRDRLRLFLQVCAAVQEAHRKLIIHRDIKPANILVDTSGQPKLLDFGIAKIVTDDGVEAGNIDSSRTALLFTPNYASPEQISGQSVGIGTDIYSLGVLLYQLLAGVLPLPTEHATPLEAARIVQEQDPRPPSGATSSAARRAELRGDLDTIVLSALRKNQAERYLSVESFAADIERYLAGFPVRARGKGFRYRAAKFVLRNRVWVAVAAALGIVVVGSGAAIVRSAQLAREQRAIAERRFGELRELANSYIYELDAKLEAIPGTTAVRTLMAQRSLKYLDRLTADSGGDVKLERDAASGYLKFGLAMGVPGYSNLGDRKSARDSMEKAVGLRRSILRANPANLEDHLMLAHTLLLQGLVELNAGNIVRAEAVHKEALGEADSILKKTPEPTGRQLNVALSAALYYAVDLGGSGVAPQLGDPVGALPHHLRSLELARREGEVRAKLPAGKANNIYRYSNLALGQDNIARLYWYGLEQPQKAREHFQSGFELLATPGVDLENAQILQKLLGLDVDYGTFLLEHGESAAALPYLRKARDGYHRLALKDPQNLSGQFDDLLACLQLGRGEALTGNVAAGFSGIESSLKGLGQLVALDPGDAIRTNGLAWALRFAADTAFRCGRAQTAAGWYAESARRAATDSAAHPLDARARYSVSQAEHGLARCLLAQHQPELARAHNAKAAAVLKPILDAHPDNPFARRLLAEATAQ
jgi:tetratricopeptide (TPR) repeat protein